MDWLAALILGAAFIGGCWVFALAVNVVVANLRASTEDISNLLKHYLEAKSPLPKPEDLREPTELEMWLQGPGQAEDDLTREFVEWCYRVYVEEDKGLLDRTAEAEGWDEVEKKKQLGIAYAELRVNGLLGTPA